MSVKIRLRRLGAKKKPYYRIVAVDSRVSTRGKILELLGHYGSIENPVKVDIDIEKVDMWVKKGAQLSDTVRSILKKAKKPQKQEKVERKAVAEGKGKGKGKEKVQKGKATRKITSSTKVAHGKKKKKLSRAH